MTVLKRKKVGLDPRDLQGGRGRRAWLTAVRLQEREGSAITTTKKNWPGAPSVEVRTFLRPKTALRSFRRRENAKETR